MTHLALHYFRESEVEVSLPAFAFGEMFEECEAAAEESLDVRDHDDAAYEGAGPTEWQGEAELVLKESAAAVLGRGEVVVMLEGGEAAAAHGVLEEVRRVEGGDEGLVKLWEAELPAAPEEAVVGGDGACELACLVQGRIRDWAHGEG